MLNNTKCPEVAQGMEVLSNTMTTSPLLDCKWFQKLKILVAKFSMALDIQAAPTETIK